MTFRDKWEPYLIGVANKDIGGFFAAAIRASLRLLSYIYAAVIRLRVFLYRHGIFRKKSLGCLVISVGNITVGGTGKTPVVEMIAKQLVNGGRKVAILSRGYKSKNLRQRRMLLWCKKSPPKADAPLAQKISRQQSGSASGGKNQKCGNFPRVVSDGSNLLLDVENSGDEPCMLAKEVPQAVVLVDKNRVGAAKYAIKKFGADTVILDDGYQYLKLNRQVNIVLIDCTNPFGRHKLLPRGILREPVQNLNRANVFFLTKTKGMDLYALKKKISIINPKAEIIETAHMPRYLNDVYTGTKKDLNWLLGKQICCVSGIADPSGFEKALNELGAVLVSCHRFPDHHLYNETEINEIIKIAQLQKAQALVTTQKDAVRFPKITVPREFPLYYLRVEIEILSGAKDFYDKIGRMCY